MDQEPALIAAIRSDDINKVRERLKLGDDPNFDLTACMYDCDCGECEECNDGCEVTISGGSTALEIAARRGNASIVKELIDAGANPNGPNSLSTSPLVMAIMGRHRAAAEVLMAAGADPKRMAMNDNERYDTPAVHARRAGLDDLVH